MEKVHCPVNYTIVNRKKILFGQLFLIQLNRDFKDMGQRDGFSSFDLEKLRRMYVCKRKKPNFGSNAGPLSGFSGRDDPIRRNPFQQLFNAYTSPQFWQEIFNSFLVPQAQPQQFDYPYYRYYG